MTEPALVSQPTNVVRVRDLTFGWKKTDTTLDIAVFDVAAGEKVFLRGPSGSGKSTLLGLVCGVLSPRAGTVEVAGQPLHTLSGARRDAVRANHLGVVFQMFNLLPFLSVLENVVLACQFAPARRARAAAQEGGVSGEARRLLTRLGVGDAARLRAKAGELSVGQQQRVAAARALIGGPELIIADEPTSALDTDARDAFLALLTEEASRYGSSLLFVSHDRGLAEHFDRAVDLAEINRAGMAGALV